jgi:transcription antitermination protein NusB
MNRKKSRDVAMKLLFEMQVKKEQYDEVIETFKENNEMDITELDFDYIFRVLKGIEENKNGIDNTIEKYLINWKLDRLSKVDIAILRVCTYEFLYEEDIPSRVSINEAIELAKKYSSENSSNFINGVLGKMINEISK